MKFSGLLLFLLVTVSVHAQSKKDSLRGRYIEPFSEYFAVWPVVMQRTLDFSVNKRGENRSIKYTPNNSVNVGLGAYLFDLAFEVTFAVPVNERSTYLYGNSTARDFQVNALSKKWGADFFHQRYSGFYYEDDEKIQLPGTPFPQRPDIAARNLGLTGLYVFNDTKFSLRSAFNFAERQIKGGGSFLLSGTINSFKLAADSAVLDSTYFDQFGEGATFNRLRYTTFSVAPGYSYNFVLRNFFLSLAVMVGPAHNWVSYTSEGQRAQYDLNINTFSSVRIGLGYSGKRFFGGLNFVRQSRNVGFDDIRFTNSSGTFRFLLGYRFKESGILKKSVWDIPRNVLKTLEGAAHRDRTNQM